MKGPYHSKVVPEVPSLKQELSSTAQFFIPRLNVEAPLSREEVALDEGQGTGASPAEDEASTAITWSLQVMETSE
ncbi:unnamed protein product [Lota lota]